MSFNQLQVPKVSLDAAVKAVSNFLSDKGLPHALIGSYAVFCLGETRYTHNVDIVVGVNPSIIKDALLETSDGVFYRSQSNKLVFRLSFDSNDKWDVIVRVHQGGPNGQRKLPDPCSVPILYVQNDVMDVPIVHLGILVLTKVKRWMFIAESTQPISVIKASNDLKDIQVILEWLKNRSLYINFSRYPEKPKEEILPGLRMLYARSSEFKVLLNATMMEEDLASIRS